jgi:threonylcarbamoyladenosine tRNA methylthiotransferase MtaB
MKLNNKLCSRCGLLCAVETGRISGSWWSWFGSGSYRKFKITDYINDLSKNDFGEVHSCEIADADFYVGSYSIGDRTRAFLKVQDGCDYKCTYCTIHLLEDFKWWIKCVWKMPTKFRSRTLRKLFLLGKYGDYGRGIWKQKTRTYFFRVSSRTIDRRDRAFAISSIEPNLLKNETIEFVSKNRTFVPHFHIHSVRK